MGDLAITGEAQRISGLLAMRQGNVALAAHHFGRGVSIFELLGDRYQTARAHFELGRAYAQGAQPERARAPLKTAVKIFLELGAQLDLERAEEALDALDATVVQASPSSATNIAPPAPHASQQLSILRLVEAVTSRELLLRELVALMRQELGIERALVFEPGRGFRGACDRLARVCAGRGRAITAAWNKAESDEAKQRLASKHGASFVRLRLTHAVPVAMLLSPRGAVECYGRRDAQHLASVLRRWD